MNNSGSSGGLGLATVLTIVFVVLQLTGAIDWSWWWVLSPLWISAAFGMAIILLVGLIAGLVAVFRRD